MKLIDPSGHIVYVNDFDVSIIYGAMDFFNICGIPTFTAEMAEVITSNEFQAYDNFRRGYVEQAIKLEELEETVNIKFGDLGYGPDSQMKENSGEYNIILNNNIYDDLTNANGFSQAGAILSASYDVVFPLSDEDVQKFWAVPQMFAGTVIMGFSVYTFYQSFGLSAYPSLGMFTMGLNMFTRGFGQYNNSGYPVFGPPYAPFYYREK